MRYVYEQKLGLFWLVMGTAALATVFVLSGQAQFWGRTGAHDFWLLPPVYLLFVGLIWRKYGVLQAVRTDERGMMVERRFLPPVVWRWEDLHASYRPSKRRGAAGVLLEAGEGGQSAEEPEPYFLLLQRLEGAEGLLQELEQRLGDRFQREEARRGGESNL
ncbi:MAG TPA: hypothetical protein VFV52_11185 [Bacilli bacterium]|nr:hypothetical protein [Bacilli bacterium]